MMKTRASPNHGPRPEGTSIDMLVLHYTGMKSASEALDRLCDAAAQVSAHYVIEEDGTVWRLVDEGQRAWHAGVSCWRGQRDVNARSIGIEICNPGHDWGYRAFPAAQMQAVSELCRAILARHPIPRRNVVGHSDVAPWRKQDPGELFDWRGLALQGIGLWPQSDSEPASIAEAPAMLARYGYDLGAQHIEAVVRAFQRHFRPSLVSGQLDAECLAVLAGLTAAIIV
ncbi:MAG: N-acetylmuramoyl-L-alanine amidase [Rhodospirillales bacterium]